MPVLGVCLGHQGIGLAFGGEVVRAPRADARQGLDDPARRPGRLRGRLAAVLGRPLSLAGRRRAAAGGARGRARAPRTARSWACAIATLPVHGVQFHPESVLTGEGRQLLRNFLELLMFAALIEKLQRREDLTVDGGRGGDGRDHGRPRAAGADRRAARSRLAMKGERPAEIVGLARTMRARATPLSQTFDAGVRHLRHRRRRRAHVQRLDRRGAGGGGVRRARREARQPIGVEPVRQRRPVRGARRQHRGARRRWSSAASTRPASRSSSRRRSIRRCGTRRRRARSSASARRSTCSAR